MNVNFKNVSKVMKSKMKKLIYSCSDFYQTEKEHSADQNTEYLKCTGINQSNKTSSEENNELPNSELPTNDTCAWYPFSSQVDFYLYVLVNSTTHPVVSNNLFFYLY